MGLSKFTVGQHNYKHLDYSHTSDVWVEGYKTYKFDWSVLMLFLILKTVTLSRFRLSAFSQRNTKHKNSITLTFRFSAVSARRQSQRLSFSHVFDLCIANAETQRHDKQKPKARFPPHKDTKMRQTVSQKHDLARISHHRRKTSYFRLVYFISLIAIQVF